MSGPLPGPPPWSSSGLGTPRSSPPDPSSLLPLPQCGVCTALDSNKHVVEDHVGHAPPHSHPQGQASPFLISVRAHKESSRLTIRFVRFLTNPAGAAGGNPGDKHARRQSLMYSLLLGGPIIPHSNFKEIPSLCRLEFC